MKIASITKVVYAIDADAAPTFIVDLPMPE
jgi:hypothetical protein